MPIVLVGEDPSVTPETSESWTAGLTYEPSELPGFRLDLNYFNTEFSDRIALPSTTFAGVIGDPAFESIINRNPSAGLLQDLFDGAQTVIDQRAFFGPPPGSPLSVSDVDVVVDTRRTNIGRTQTSGIDGSLTYEWTVGETDFNVGGSATYILELDDELRPGSGERERFDIVFEPARFTARSSFGVQQAGLGVTTFLNYVGGYSDVRFDPENDVGSFTTIDLNIAYEFSQTQGTGLTDGLSLNFNVLNVFDEEPPFVEPDPSGSGLGIGYDPVNSTGLGRFVSFEIRKRW